MTNQIAEFEKAADLSSVPTLSKFQELCRQTWEQRIKVDEMTSAVNHESKMLEAMKAKVLAYMEQVELEKQHVPSFGTLSVVNRLSVKVPAGDSKAEFFEYLKGLGVFEDMATVHSQTLNAWYKEKFEEALSQGNVDFKIPGIEEPKIAKTLGMRRG